MQIEGFHLYIHSSSPEARAESSLLGRQPNNFKALKTSLNNNERNFSNLIRKSYKKSLLELQMFFFS